MSIAIAGDYAHFAIVVSFRGEIFNLFNRANFSLPNMQVFNGSGQRLAAAGRITSTANPSRQVQLGLRMNW